jgi:hypothetical protein
MNGTIVYSATNVASTDGVIQFNHHTDALYLWNKSNTTSAIVVLNGKHQVAIPHTVDNGSHMYHIIPGDYTTLEIITSSCPFAVYAIG